MNLKLIIKLASAFGHSNIVKLLIDNKADVNVRNNYGNNAVSIGIYLK
jgi:ankyrin repeat protein